MNSESILKSDIIDIIFENRNKNYGAYVLRKYYQDRLIKSFGLMLILVMIVTAICFINTKKKSVVSIAGEYYLSNVLPKIKQPALLKQVVKQNRSGGHLIKAAGLPLIVNHTDAVDSIKQSDSVVSVISTSGGTSSGTVIAPTSGSDNVTTGAVAGSGIKNNPANNLPIETAEVMPQYPGGSKALRKFFERNLVHPDGTDNTEEVNVKIRMVVDYNGKLQNFEVLEDGGNQFTGEVIRVLKKMPDWIPGKSNGQNVSVYYTIPVKFTIAE